MCNKGRALQEIAHLDPDSPMHEQRLHEEALECCDKAVKIDPNDARALFNKGTSCILVGRNEESFTCLEKAVEIDPTLLERNQLSKD